MKTEAQVKKEMSIINSVMSIFMTVVGVGSIAILNHCYPSADEFQRILLCMPGMVLLAMAILFLIKPDRSIEL